MKTIKQYKKMIITIIFALVIGIIMLLNTKVSAYSFTVTSASNIVNHQFTPYKADGRFVYYCIHKGSPYKANLPAGYSEGQTYGEWCTTCGPIPAKPTVNGATWGVDNVKSMEYTEVGPINDREYQDAAYVMASAYESGKIEDMGTQYSIWDTKLNLGHAVPDKGTWGPEANNYLAFYKLIHNGTTDIYSSKLYDKTDINNVTVEVNQTAKTYIVGPFQVEYPKGEYGNQKWSYITNIHLLDQENRNVGNVVSNTIHIIDANGNELRDSINGNNFPNQNVPFYVKFSSTLGDANGGISHIKLKVDFKYLESCTATMSKFNGILKSWVWQKVPSGKTCTNERHLLGGSDPTMYTWKLKVTQGATPQELMAFKCDDDVHGYGGHASKNYGTASIIVAPSSIDLTMKLSGQVFLDRSTGKVNLGNNIMDGNNEALNGVEVVLYDAVTNQIVTKTNKLQQYHVHTESCYTETAHIHTGSAFTGGGCYTNKIHDHIGSWEQGGPGTCYTSPIKHVHTGSPTPNVTMNTTTHHHEGSSTSGGGCYTVPVYHKHVNSCYTSSHTHSSACYTEKDCLVSTGWDPMSTCSNCGGTYHTIYWRCTVCGATKTTQSSICSCGAHPDSGGTRCHSEKVNICGLEEKRLICSKTENSTIDSYKLGCNKTEGQTENRTTITGSGCYTKPVYVNHNHTSACYSNVGHTHNDSCYITCNHTMNHGVLGMVRRCETCNVDTYFNYKVCNLCNSKYDYIEMRCPCRKYPTVNAESLGIITGNKVLVCDQTLSESVLICGNVSGKVVDHYEIGCGVSEGAMCWSLTCSQPLYQATCTGARTKVLTCGKSGTVAGTTNQTLLNPVTTQKVGNKDGYYEFDGLDSMKTYYVKFVYNGILYTNVELEKAFNTDNGSKADETTRYNYRLPLNEQFKEIGSYPSNYQIKTKVFGNELGDYNKIYLQEEVSDIFKLISLNMVGTNTDNYILACTKTYNTLRANSNYSSISNEEIKRMIQFAADCRISAYTTRNYPLTKQFTLDNSSRRIDGVQYYSIYTGQYNQLHVNLGIKERPTFDLALYKDVLKADVQINGKTETYNYDSRKQNGTFTVGISENDYLNGLRGAYQNSYPYVNALRTRGIENDSYDINMRSEEVANGQSSNYNSNVTGKVNGNYQVNDNYNNLKQDGQNKADRLKVYVTYKIAIKNQSGVTGAITEIVDYFDPNYKFVESYVGDANGRKTGDVTKYDTSKYQANTQYKSNKGAYTTVYLRPNQETRLGANEEQYIYVKLQLLGSANDAGTLLSGKLLNNQTLNTMNLAEINGYKTYNAKTGSGTPGLIDIDSKPGNLNISNIASLSQENITKYPNIRDMYEDDTSRAPVMIYKISESRTVEGKVFEDSTGKNSNVYTKQTREGNGKIESSEKGINGVIVELVEIKNGEMHVRATTTTNAAGWYGFTGFLPGNYTVRYTYGLDDKTAMMKTSKYYKGLNDKSYNGQDYQSTKFGKKADASISTVNYKTDQALVTKYNNNNANKNTEESSVNVATNTVIDKYQDGNYWYTIADNLSDARDDAYRTNQVIQYSKAEYGREITNHKAEVFKSYEATQPSHISKEDNRKLANELERRTYRYAYTPLMEVEVEYATKVVTGNKKYTHAIKGLDFGLVERPKSEVTLDQDVKNIKVTLADGTVLFDTDKEINNLQWIANGEIDKYDKNEQINIIMDDELLSGAKLEVTYYLTVTNNSENNTGTTRAKGIINYVANNLNFDVEDNKLNGKALWKVVRKDEIQRASNSTLINNEIIDLSTQSVILQATEDNPLVRTNLKPGEKVTSELVLKKVLSAENSSDDLRYTNMTELVEIDNTVGRYDYGATPGNQKLELQPQEHDTSGASRNVSYDNGNIDNEHPQDGTIIITPPTGSTYIYYTIGIVGALVLIGGIVLIKKFVLDARK